MAQSFLSQYIGNLEQQDVLFGNEKFVIVDTENGKLIPLSIMEEYLYEANSYKPGDTFRMSIVGNYPGFAFNSGKTVRFMIMLDKPILANTVNVSCSQLNIRGDKGYVAQSVDIDTFNKTVNFDKNAISITLESSTAMNVTTNTPVSVYGSMVITFS